jgi:hypothetical protein
MRYISFRYIVNGPTKPQEALSNHEAEYFRQSQASLFWPIRTAAIAYKKAFAGNFGHQNRPIDEERRNSYSGPSGYRASRSTCPGSEAPGSNCHRVEVGWQTNKDPGGLSLILPTPDKVGPYRLLERRALCPYGG